MKKHTLFILFLLILQSSLAQVKISGKVISSDKLPVVGASVYINNSTVGTTTNDQGEFTLILEKGFHNLVISFIGFKTIKYNINTENYKTRVFRIREDKNVLDEVVVKTKKKKLPKSKRKLYLRIFKRNFIGESKIASQCKILNPEVLKFKYNKEKGALRVKASQPLKIINPTLGYLIEYDLFNFTYEENGFYNYKGFIKFSQLKGSDDEKKEWKINRYEAYKGSERHFFSAIVNERVDQEKFRVDHVKRVKNPEYPSALEIKKAKDILNTRNRARLKSFTFDKKFSNPIDYAEDVMKRSNLSPYKIETMGVFLPLYKYGFYDGRNIFLRFTDYLLIIYEEKPDKNFKTAHPKYKDLQFTLIKSLKGNDIILKRPGYAFNPDEMYKEEYWAFKRIGDLLPTNYKAPN